LQLRRQAGHQASRRHTTYIPGGAAMSLLKMATHPSSSLAANCSRMAFHPPAQPVRGVLGEAG
jgi:hypothetical protein